MNTYFNSCTPLWLTELEQSTPPRRLIKGISSKFCVGPWVRYETHEEDRRTHQPKREYDNEDEDSSPYTLSDKKLGICKSRNWKYEGRLFSFNLTLFNIPFLIFWHSLHTIYIHYTSSKQALIFFGISQQH